MPDPDLVRHVAASTGLSPAEAARVVDDVLAFHSESTEEYVRRRHTELQTYGVRNSAIFPTLQAELRARRVRAPELTERQLRRIAYG